MLNLKLIDLITKISNNQKISPEELDEALKALEADFKLAGLGYDYPVLKGADVNKALTLRK